MYPIFKLSDREYNFLRENTPPAKVNLWKAFAQDYSISPNSMIVLAIEGENHLVMPVGHAMFEQTDYLSIEEAWNIYSLGNCFMSKSDFQEAIKTFPNVCKSKKVFCTILRDVIISDELTSLPGESLTFVNSNVTALFSQNEFPYTLQSENNHEPKDIIDSYNPFVPLDNDQTKLKIETESVVREGQEEFRRSLFSAYGGKCCITGESTKEVLQAAHIQSYINKHSHHIQNGLLLRSDFHLLYDSGLMTILEDYTIRISRNIDSEYYQSFNGKKINLPSKEAWHPSKQALMLKTEEFKL